MFGRTILAKIVIALNRKGRASKTGFCFSRHSLVVKHCLGKTETVSPILTDGSKDTFVSLCENRKGFIY